MTRRSPLQFVLLGLIRGYQMARAGRPSPCRFIPSCSAYGHEAVLLHGGIRGGWLAIRRIARCRPGGGHGVDLVPEPRRKTGVDRAAVSTPPPVASVITAREQTAETHTVSAECGLCATDRSATDRSESVPAPPAFDEVRGSARTPSR